MMGIKKTMKKINIGDLIRNKLKEDGHSALWLAERLHCKRDKIYKIFRKTSIDTELLQQISFVMGFDFFRHYSDY
jgi:plasmid maintenance system antidote protein VapI